MAEVRLDRPEYREVMQSYAKMALGERAREPDESDESTPEQWGYDKAWLEDKGVAPAGVAELLDIACGGGCPLAFGERTEGIGTLPDVGGTILDLGCGGGHDCALASNIVGESGRVIGIDLTQEMLDRTAKTVEAFGRSAPLELICTPIDQAASLPNIPAGVADIVISNGVFNLCVDKQAAFNTAFHATKPGGSFWLTDVVIEPGTSNAVAGSS